MIMPIDDPMDAVESQYRETADVQSGLPLAGLALVGVLVAALSAFASKRNQSRKVIPQKGATAYVRGDSSCRLDVGMNLNPATPSSLDSDASKDHIPRRKPIFEWGALLTTIGLLIVNIFLMR
jgi:hypothetical protein